MKTNNYFYGMALIGGLFSIGACSDYEDETAVADAQNLSLNKVAPSPTVNDQGVLTDDQMLTDEDALGHKPGFLYVQGNEADVNQIYIYQQKEGSELILLGKVSSGGAGTATSMESQGALAIDREKMMLYAVNAGDNTISSFQIKPDGNVVLLKTVSSQGIMPVSLSVRNGLLYVVNKESSSIAGFQLGDNGMMVPISNSVKPLSSTIAGAASIAISPTMGYVYVTEKQSDKISQWRLTSTGMPGVRTTIDAAGKSPFGMAFSQGNYMIVSNGVGSMLTPYNGLTTGSLGSVTAGLANNQMGAGSIISTKHGGYAFVTNTGSDNISSYKIAANGSMEIVDAGILTGDGPNDISIASNNISVYVLADNDNIIHSYLRLRSGYLKETTKTFVPAPYATGLATW